VSEETRKHRTDFVQLVFFNYGKIISKSIFEAHLSQIRPRNRVPAGENP